MKPELTNCSLIPVNYYIYGTFAHLTVIQNVIRSIIIDCSKSFSVINEYLPVADLRGALPAPPHGPKFPQFHAVVWKILTKL